MAYNRDMSLRDHINEGWLASTDADGNRMSYDDYVKNYLWSNGLPADTNIDNATTSYKSDDNLNRNFTVTDTSTGKTLGSQNWVGGDEGWTNSMLTAIALWAGGYGLGAAAAGAGAGVGAAAGGAGEAGAAGAAGAASGAGELGAGIGALGSGESGLAALGADWSPSALGLTNSITPAISSGELAALGSGIPAVGEAAAAGGAGSALGGSVQTLDPVTVTGTSTGGATGSAAGGASAGGSVSSLDDLFQQAADEALNSSGNYYVQSPTTQWWTDVSNAADAAGGSVTDYLKSIGQNLPSTGTSGSSTGKTLLQQLLGGNSTTGTSGSANLGTLLGGLLGAASSQSGTTTQTKAPWEAAQPYLKGLLSDADTMRQNLAQNPYTAQQTNAYNQAYSGLDQARAAMPGLLNWSQNATQSKSTTPSYQQLFSQVKPS